MVRSCITLRMPRQSNREQCWSEWNNRPLRQNSLYERNTRRATIAQNSPFSITANASTPFETLHFWNANGFGEMRKYGKYAKKRKTWHDSILNSLHKQFFTISNMRIMFSFSRFRPNIIFAFPSFSFFHVRSTTLRISNHSHDMNSLYNLGLFHLVFHQNFPQIFSNVSIPYRRTEELGINWNVFPGGFHSFANTTSAKEWKWKSNFPFR